MQLSGRDFPRSRTTIKGREKEDKHAGKHGSETNAIARRGQGGDVPLRGQGAELPCGVWGNAPTVSTGDQLKGSSQQRRRQRSVPASNFALPQKRPQAASTNAAAHCRAKWARPTLHDLPIIAGLFRKQGFRLCGGDKGAMETDEVCGRPPLTLRCCHFWVYLRLVFDCFGKICVKLVSLNFFLPHQAGIFACNREISFSIP